MGKKLLLMWRNLPVPIIRIKFRKLRERELIGNIVKRRLIRLIASFNY